MVYWVVVAVTFVVQVKNVKETWMATRGHLCRLRAKYYLQLIFVGGVCFCEGITLVRCLRIASFNGLWLNELDKYKGAYQCTSPDVWIDLETIESDFKSSSLSSNVFALMLVSLIMMASVLIQFYAHGMLLSNFFHQLEERQEIELKARAISVGLPLEEPSEIVDWETGFSYGQAVPEADRL